MKNLGRVAVVGAGMAGLTAARALLDAGAAVTVFDKGRRAGGRLATRRVERWVFNHGCQFFTARDAGFAAAVAGVSAPWAAAGEGRFSGVPDMAAVAGHLATGLDVRQSVRIWAVSRKGDGWSLLLDGADEYHCNSLILAIPAPQARQLLASDDPVIHDAFGHPEFAARLQNVHLAPCWAVMLGYAAEDAPQGSVAVGAREGDVSWVAREESRPGAVGWPGYTIHASAGWSAAHLEDAPEAVIAALAAAAGIEEKPVYAAAHRWRYALADAPLGEPFLWDARLGLGLSGDWCLGGRLEAAYLSGRALAAAMLA